MNNLILDSGVAALACVGNYGNDSQTILFQELIASDAKLWLYTGQALEIISKIQVHLLNVGQAKNPIRLGNF